jgi:hypothetical protein
MLFLICFVRSGRSGCVVMDWVRIRARVCGFVLKRECTVSGGGRQGGARTGLGDVPNPDYEELEDLLRDVQGYQGLNSGVLDRAARLMGTGGAWTGPSTATVFETEVQGRQGSLPGYLDGLVEAVGSRMSQVPATVNVLGL